MAYSELARIRQLHNTKLMNAIAGSTTRYVFRVRRLVISKLVSARAPYAIQVLTMMLAGCYAQTLTQS